MGLDTWDLMNRNVLREGEEIAFTGYPIGAVLGLAAGWGAARSWLRRSPPRYRLSRAEAA
mgnify:CR=1 FL=1